MEVITIDSKAFKELESIIKNIEEKFSQIVKLAHQPLADKWLDNHEVCQLLKVSKRTMQYYREEGVVPYTVIRHKVFYKASDIDELLLENYHRNNFK